MVMDIKYRLTRQRTHCRWDHSIPPLVTIEPGEVVELETKEASDGQPGRLLRHIGLPAPDIFVS